MLPYKRQYKGFTIELSIVEGHTQTGLKNIFSRAIVMCVVTKGLGDGFTRFYDLHKFDHNKWEKEIVKEMEELLVIDGYYDGSALDLE